MLMEFYSRYFDGTRNEMVWHHDHKGKSQNFAKSRNFPYSSKFHVSVTPFSNSCKFYKYFQKVIQTILVTEI